MLTKLTSSIFWNLQHGIFIKRWGLGELSNLDGYNCKIEVLSMTINKYFVFVPQQEERGMNKEHKVENEQETQRQALVKQAQQQGGVQG